MIKKLEVMMFGIAGRDENGEVWRKMTTVEAEVERVEKKLNEIIEAINELMELMPPRITKQIIRRAAEASNRDQRELMAKLMPKEGRKI